MWVSEPWKHSVDKSSPVGAFDAPGQALEILSVLITDPANAGTLTSAFTWREKQPWLSGNNISLAQTLTSLLFSCTCLHFMLNMMDLFPVFGYLWYLGCVPGGRGKDPNLFCHCLRGFLSVSNSGM